MVTLYNHMLIKQIIYVHKLYIFLLLLPGKIQTSNLRFIKSCTTCWFLCWATSFFTSSEAFFIDIRQILIIKKLLPFDSPWGTPLGQIGVHYITKLAQVLTVDHFLFKRTVQCVVHKHQSTGVGFK